MIFERKKYAFSMMCIIGLIDRENIYSFAGIQTTLIQALPDKFMDASIIKLKPENTNYERL